MPLISYDFNVLKDSPEIKKELTDVFTIWVNDILNVTVDFVAEIITCIKDKEKNIISGDAEKIKKIYDTWVFSRDTKSVNPNWQLVDILT